MTGAEVAVTLVAPRLGFAVLVVLVVLVVFAAFVVLAVRAGFVVGAGALEGVTPELSIVNAVAALT